MAVSRRGFLGGVGLAGAGLTVAAGCSDAAPAKEAVAQPSPTAGTVPFHGQHQAGIATETQDQLAFATFDLSTRSRGELIELLQTWTTAAAAMTAGQPVIGDSASDQVPPADTGEAAGLAPNQLTITIGFGPKLFDSRFGLADRRPAALVDLPALPGDQLDPSRCGGDIGVQACANDPQVAFHAIRNLNRLALGTAAMRWSQLGFGKTASTSAAQATPRNLMGFKDGTRNIRGEDAATMGKYVWVGAESDQKWLHGGSFLVARRIKMQIESWDHDYLANQQAVFGRHKVTGAPLTGSREFDKPNLAAKDSTGAPVIAADAHIRLAGRESNNGLQILRRGYSFTDGMDSQGLLDAGLFFLAYQKNPDQFITLQRKLGSHDALNEYISHTGSAVFACPPGVQKDDGFWGEALFT
jgi:deferrochelatase/peroxidase EfeB